MQTIHVNKPFPKIDLPFSEDDQLLVPPSPMRRLAVQVVKQEEVTECSIRRISRMHNSGAFGSDNLLPRPFSVVSWCIIEREVNILKRLPTLAIAEIPFVIRRGRCTKELPLVPHPGRQSSSIMDAGRRSNNGNEVFWSDSSVLFESEEWLSTEPMPNHGGTRNSPMIHRQLINVRSLSFSHGARHETIPRKR
jgi:hypothetical protein